MYIYRQTDGQTDTAKSTQLITLIIYVYILKGLRRFLLGVTNFVANLIYPVQSIINTARHDITKDFETYISISGFLKFLIVLHFLLVILNSGHKSLYSDYFGKISIWPSLVFQLRNVKSSTELNSQSSGGDIRSHFQ